MTIFNPPFGARQFDPKEIPVPEANSTDDEFIQDVVGKKADAAQTVVGTTRSLMAYIKGLLGFQTVPTANSTDNAQMRDVVGNKTDTSFSNGAATPSLAGHLKANYYHVHDSAKVWPSGYGAVSAQSISAAGTGYAPADELTASGGTGATFSVDTVDTGGEVLTVTRLTNGTGHIGDVTATTTDSTNGTGCTLDLTTDYYLGKAAIQLTAHATDSWRHGTIVEIVAASAIGIWFDIHWVVASNASAADDYELRVFKGASGSEIEIGRISFSRNAANDRAAAYVPVQVPPQAPNTRISMSLAAANAARTCDVKIYYHTYPDIT